MEIVNKSKEAKNLAKDLEHLGASCSAKEQAIAQLMMETARTPARSVHVSNTKTHGESRYEDICHHRTTAVSVPAQLG